MFELYVCTAEAVAESDEMQDLGPEMRKNGLAGETEATAESGKMCFFDQNPEQ